MPDLRESSTATTVAERLFIAVPLPEHLTSIISDTFRHFPQHIEQAIPSAKWHVTIAWLGEPENPKQYYSRINKPLPQSFVPTVRFTHVGRGRPDRGQLWVYAEPSAVLAGIRQQVLARLKKMRFPLPAETSRTEFTPHVTVAKLFSQIGHIGIADQALVTSFSFDHLLLYRSRPEPGGSRYVVESVISLV